MQSLLGLHGTVIANATKRAQLGLRWKIHGLQALVTVGPFVHVCGGPIVNTGHLI
jgi:hypothetical protein